MSCSRNISRLYNTVIAYLPTLYFTRKYMWLAKMYSIL